MKFKKMLSMLLVSVMLLSLCACGKTEPPTPTAPVEVPAPTETPAEKPTPTPIPAPTAEPEPSSENAMRPEFKEAMDSLLAFYEKYAEVVKRYAEAPGDITVLTEYMDMVSRAVEMEEKFDAWDEDELSGEELKYYLEISAKILSCSAEIAKAAAEMENKLVDVIDVMEAMY